VPRHAAPRRVPASLRCARGGAPGLTCAPQAVTASPAAFATLTAALISRSSRVPHAGHVHSRTCRGLGPCLSPRSTPVTDSVLGSVSGLASVTKLAKYRSAESLITVTLDGVHRSGRDHRTDTSPTLGRRSFPLGSTLNRALVVNRMACRRSLRDRNRGGLTFAPFRSPLREAKKFRYAAFRSAWACWRTTADTSLSHARSAVALAAVSPADSSASVT